MVTGPVEDLDRFRSQYGSDQSKAALQVQRTVFGRGFCVNGYTTVEQARRLGEVLGVGPTSLMLDVGAGRGWPGIHLASSTGCQVVLSDVPVEGLRRTRRHALGEGVSGRVAAVAAEGGALPFPAGSFDGVVHTDVLC